MGSPLPPSTSPTMSLDLQTQLRVRGRDIDRARIVRWLFDGALELVGGQAAFYRRQARGSRLALLEALGQSAQFLGI